MTPNKQRFTIAETCGRVWHSSLADDPEFFKILPDYLHDLNAMRKAEETLTTHKERAAYVQAIVPEDFNSADAKWLLATASAARRAEAFLKAKGLWED